jgi:hypothetical protein
MGRSNDWWKFGLVVTWLMSGVACSGAGLRTDFEEIELRISGNWDDSCGKHETVYRVTAAGELSRTRCDESVIPAESTTSMRTLSSGDLASVRDALSEVTESNAETCGRDAPVLTLDLTTRDGVERYADDFYSGCPWDAHKGRTFVSGLGTLKSALAHFSGP